MEDEQGQGGVEVLQRRKRVHRTARRAVVMSDHESG
jgi:hypothetical protein